LAIAAALIAGCDSRSESPRKSAPSATAPAIPPATAPTSRPTPTGPQPKIEVEAPNFGLGKRWSTEPPVKHDFVIKNAGEAALNIKGVISSCGCTTVGAKQVKLQPGQTWKLPVELDLSKQKSLVMHTISVYSNDPRCPKLDLKIHGFVRKPIVTAPRNAHFFGRIGKDETRTREIAIKNQTDKPMDLKLTRQDGKTFTAKIEIVDPGKEYKLLLTARPPYKPGATVGRIELSTGLELEPKLLIRPQVHLPQRLLVTPRVLTVAQPLPMGAKQVLSVRNNGTTDVSVTRVTCSIEGVTTEITRLPNGKVHNVRVRFPNGLKLPPAGGQLTVHTDDKEMPKLEVRIVPLPRATTKPVPAPP
jgi:hypothetical protein